MGVFDTLYEELGENIQGVNRYNPENVTKLEACVRAMAAESKYDRDICLTTLKLYQLNPDRYDDSIVRTVLLKTLTMLPAADFALAKCLVDANRLNSPDLKRVLDLGAVLESCNFAVFWKLMKGDYKPSNESNEPFRQPAEVAKLVRTIAGFEEAVRVFVCRVVSVTYQNIAIPVITRLLGGVSEKQLSEYARRFNWTEKPDEKAFFVANHEASIKSRNIDEKLQFANVTEILQQVAQS